MLPAVLAIGGAGVGCGTSDTPLGGPYGGTTQPTPPDVENASEPDASGGPPGSAGSTNGATGP